MAEETPNTLGEVLAELPPGTLLLVADELLSLWFPPGIVAGQLDDESRRAAEARAIEANCAFEYVPAEQAGRFTKNKSM